MADVRSSNPFRRRSGVDATATATATATPTPPLSTVSGDPIFESSRAPADPSPIHPNTSDYFRQHLQAASQANQPPPSTSFQKPKVVKKVRVQSPPPSSPESASAVPDEYPAYGPDHDEDNESSSSDDVEAEDPFRATVPGLGLMGHGNYGSLTTSLPPTTGQQPPNPFSKTLEDMEHSGKDNTSRPTALTTPKGSLDVDAFKRLLMTGQSVVAGTTPSVTSTADPHATHPPSQAADSASITDASSVSRQSALDQTLAQETPRTSHETSEDERLGLVSNPHARLQQATPSTLRKKPPPPSSRHGRLINADLAQNPAAGGPAEDGSTSRPLSSLGQIAFTTSPGASSPLSREQPTTPSDVDKPLPPAPVPHPTEEGTESIFDREAAGKLPEVAESDHETDAAVTPHLPSPPIPTHITTTAAAPHDQRRPAPPPRRNPHHRSESKASVSAIPKALSPTGMPPTPEEGQRRSSHESTLSRSSSMRANAHAPAPPPPRRPNHGSRSSTGFHLASPSAISLTPTQSVVASPVALVDHHPPFFTGHQVSPEPISPALSHLHQSSPLAPQTKVKPAAPPPPPARHSSMRSTGRPASVSSFDATSRRMPAREKDGGAAMTPPPPPPPKRSRAGSGRFSSENGLDQGRLPAGPVTEELGLAASPSVETAGSGQASPEPSRRSEDKSADDILADLHALQQEVDALRGRYEKKVVGGG